MRRGREEEGGRRGMEEGEGSGRRVRPSEAPRYDPTFSLRPGGRGECLRRIAAPKDCFGRGGGGAAPVHDMF